MPSKTQNSQMFSFVSISCYMVFFPYIPCESIVYVHDTYRIITSLITWCKFTGNRSGDCRDNNETDYCTSYSFPFFDTIEAHTTEYVLKIPIIDDGILEGKEVIRITAIPSTSPNGYDRNTTDLIIEDNDSKFLFYIR